jgi:ABC-type transport system substrate-binding protein
MYGFWHSSQRNDPGVNISQYTNIDVDGLVLKLRTEQNEEIKTELYTKFEEEIKKYIPAVFLYARKFNYTSPPSLVTNTPLSVVYSSERFSMVHTWHIETDEVWPIFNNNNN